MSVDIRYNEYGTEAGEALWKAISTNICITSFNKIPIHDIREGKITELDLNGKGLCDGDACVLAQLLKVRMCACGP